MHKLSVYLPVSDNGGGSCKTGYAVDMMGVIASGVFNGRKIKIDELSGSHADRACNNMANRFMRTDCDAMFIVDIDTRVRAVDFERALSHIERGVKAVWGLYPKKQDDAPPCINTWPTVPDADEFGLVDVRRAGRGFLCVAREVFERLKIENGGPAGKFFNHDEPEWAFFHSGIVYGFASAMLNGEPEWISEDWMFCEDIRHYLKIPTLVDTGIVLRHVGEKTYSFPADRVVRVDTNITSWRDIHGWFDYEVFYRFLVKEIPDGGHFVEVGCWLGKSIAAFHEFSRANGSKIELSVVDTFQGAPANPEHAAILKQFGGNVRKQFQANMDALGIQLQVFPFDSAQAATGFEDGSLDAVFIDADHRYEYVLKDIQTWLPKVKPGGIISGHDIDEKGVTEAVVVAFKNQACSMGRCWYVRV